MSNADIIAIRIRQLQAEDKTPLEISEEIGHGLIVRAWLDSPRDDPDGELACEVATQASAMLSDAEDMEQALELTASGWEAQTPSPPAGDTFWHQTRVMSWYWRRPARTKTRPGRLFLSTNQAWRAMRREKGLPLE